jgi:hypothetical protein
MSRGTTGEFINAARKRPSASPPLVSICSSTDVAPALSPHLHVLSAKERYGK